MYVIIYNLCVGCVHDYKVEIVSVQYFLIFFFFYYVIFSNLYGYCHLDMANVMENDISTSFDRVNFYRRKINKLLLMLK